MTVESDYRKVGLIVTSPASRYSIEVFTCKKCKCLVASGDRKTHTKEQHPKNIRIVNTKQGE